MRAVASSMVVQRLWLGHREGIDLDFSKVVSRGQELGSVGFGTRAKVCAIHCLRPDANCVKAEQTRLRGPFNVAQRGRVWHLSTNRHIPIWELAVSGSALDVIGVWGPVHVSYIGCRNLKWKLPLLFHERIHQRKSSSCKSLELSSRRGRLWKAMHQMYGVIIISVWFRFC